MRLGHLIIFTRKPSILLSTPLIDAIDIPLFWKVFAAHAILQCYLLGYSKQTSRSGNQSRSGFHQSDPYHETVLLDDESHGGL